MLYKKCSFRVFFARFCAQLYRKVVNCLIIKQYENISTGFLTIN